MLVLRPGALGDTLLAVPALRALRRAVSPVTLAAHGGAARLLESLGEVDHGLAFDDPSLAWLFDQQPKTNEPIVAWMNADISVALENALVRAPSRPTSVEHAARYLLRTLAPLLTDVSYDDRPLSVRPIETEDVLVHPGSGSAAKNWPAENFAAVIKDLGRDNVRLIVGEGDLRAATAVEAALGQKLMRLEHPDLSELAQRLAGCRAYLGNDSGVSHLAGLCGARMVAMFGPTNAEIWRPIGPDIQVRRFGTDPQAVAALLRS